MRLKFLCAVSFLLVASMLPISAATPTEAASIRPLAFEATATFGASALSAPAVTGMRYSVLKRAVLAANLVVIGLLSSAQPSRAQERLQVQMQLQPAPPSDIASHVGKIRSRINDIEKTYSVSDNDRIDGLKRRASAEAILQHDVQRSVDQRVLIYLLQTNEFSNSKSVEFLKILAINYQPLPEATENAIYPALLAYNSANTPAQKENAAFELGIAISLPKGLNIVKDLLESRDLAKRQQAEKAIHFYDRFGYQQFLHPGGLALLSMSLTSNNSPLDILRDVVNVDERLKALQTINGWPDAFLPTIESVPEGRAVLLSQLLDPRTLPLAVSILNKAIQFEPLSMTPAAEALLNETMAQAKGRGDQADADALLALREKIKTAASGKPITEMKDLAAQPSVFLLKLNGSEENTNAGTEVHDFWALWKSPFGERAVQGFQNLNQNEAGLFAPTDQNAVLNFVTAFKNVLNRNGQDPGIIQIPRATNWNILHNPFLPASPAQATAALARAA
jgi:hypothetical protein